LHNISNPVVTGFLDPKDYNIDNTETDFNNKIPSRNFLPTTSSSKFLDSSYLFRKVNNDQPTASKSNYNLGESVESIYAADPSFIVKFDSPQISVRNPQYVSECSIHRSNDFDINVKCLNNKSVCDNKTISRTMSPSKYSIGPGTKFTHMDVYIPSGKSFSLLFGGLYT
jgi:hypothetical protein